MSMRFKDKIVAITGGSDGIGLAAARQFAAEGGQVYITGRDQARLARALQHIGHGAVAVQGDASNPEDLDRLYARILGDHGRLDVLFANAGVAEKVPRPLEAMTEEAYRSIFDLNVLGVIFSVQKALPLLVEGASVVLNASVAGSKGFPGQTLYNASKAAVRSFARTWTAELKDRGIRVNVVSPSGTETRPMREFLEQRPGLEDMLRQMVPLARLGDPDEVARAVLFLASADSSYIAGTELFVDGGSMAV